MANPTSPQDPALVVLVREQEWVEYRHLGVDVGGGVCDLERLPLLWIACRRHLDFEFCQCGRAPERAARTAKRQPRIGQQLDSESPNRARLELGFRRDHAPRRRVALRQDGLVGQHLILLAAAQLDVRVQNGPLGLAGGLGLFPSGHPFAPVRAQFAQSGLDLPYLREDLAAQPVFVRGEDRPRGFVRVVDVREHPVVVALADRVELVIVALGALHGQAQHGLADGVHAVEHGLHAELLWVGPALFVDHRVAQEAGSDALLLGRVRQQVARDLLDHEAVIGHVRVEGVNDPIAIEPDLARLVLLKAVRIGVAGSVQPDAPPALAVMRRCEQTIHQASIGARRRVVQVVLGIFERGGQPGQVKAQAADQSVFAGGRRRFQAFGLQSGQHEAVNRTLGSPPVVQPGPLRPRGRNERPVLVQRGVRSSALGPDRSGLDPGLDLCDLRVAELAVHGHSVALAEAGHSLVYGTCLGVVGHDPRPAWTGASSHAARIEPQLAELLLLTVAAVTVVSKDRLDLGGEVGTASDACERNERTKERDRAHKRGSLPLYSRMLLRSRSRPPQPVSKGVPPTRWGAGGAGAEN